MNGDPWSTSTKVALVAFGVVALAAIIGGVYALGVSP